MNKIEREIATISKTATVADIYKREVKTMIFAIDFDGTIVENKYPEIGRLNEEMADFIYQLKEKGHTWILWTSRCGEDLQKAIRFLEMNGMKPDFVNENAKNNLDEYPDNPRKIFADIYIDDRNAGGLVIPWDLI